MQWRRSLVVLSIVMVVAFGVAWMRPDAVKASSDTVTLGPLRALSAKTGDVVWRATPPRGSFYDVAAGSTTIVGLSGGCLANGHGINDPRVVAMDARTGRRLWVVHGESVTSRTSTSGAPGIVAVDARGIVVVKTRQGTAGLDAPTGRVRWKLEVSPLGASDSLVFAPAPPNPPISDRLAFSLSAYDRVTGRLRWSFGDYSDSAWSRTWIVAAANDQTVVIANGGFNQGSSSGPGQTTFFVLDAQSGAEVGRFSGEPTVIFSDFSLVEGSLVFAEGAAMVARNLPTGALRWRREFDPARFPPEAQSNVGPVLVAPANDGDLVFAHTELGPTGEVDAIDARTGDTVWSASRVGVMAANAHTTVTLDEGTAPSLNALESSTGTKRWQRTIGREANVALTDSRIAVTSVCEMR